MKLIVAVSRNWGIGRENSLLFNLKEDMKHFKKMTTGKVVVMGKNTYLSLPVRPLKDRINIVLSKTALMEECITVRSLNELFDIISQFSGDDVFIIGGASIYRTLLPYCDTAFVTKVDADALADAYIDNLDELQGWECVEVVKGETSGLSFCTYKNSCPKEYVYED